MKIRGLTEHQEQDPRLLLRDTRTIGEHMHHFFESPRNGAIVLLGSAVAVLFVKSIADFIFLFCLGVFWYSYKRETTLPVRLPLRSQMHDYHDLKPGGHHPNMAQGIYFYGNEAETNEEVWFSDTDMRTHTLFFGSTGSGKTEALIGIAFNSLVQGSGFIYVDGKGDNTLFAKIFSMARSVGREDDVLLINYMTGARDIVGPQERRLSNTLNPFSQGSSSMLTQLVVSLMSQASGTPDGDMWKGRAIAFVEALMKMLVYMRDQEKILLDANSIRNYFDLARLESIVIDKKFPRDNQEAVDISDIPALIMEPIYNYVVTLPGYNKEKKGKQVSQVWEQHGFITMQLVRVFSSLADTYGHILRTKLAEVDLRDVILNRRILVVLLPALEKSPDELANLGKIIMASMRAMMAAGLGEEVEGDYHDLVLSKPTNAATPYLCILDEYGYYAVPGFAVVPAQARSLGFSVIFAGQDLPSFQRASKEEAASIGANTNIKIAMKMEDPLETWDFFMRTAGEAYVTKVDAFHGDADSLLHHYSDTHSASAERRSRIDLLDLKDQRQGEAHLFFQSKIVRYRTFYANPTHVEKMRLTHFLQVDLPKNAVLIELEHSFAAFADVVKEGNVTFNVPEFSQHIQTVSDTLHHDTAPTLIERGVSALIAIQEQTQSVEIGESEEELAKEGTLNIFSPITVPELTHKFVSPDELSRFTAPLLQKSICNEKIGYTERLFGKSDAEANKVSMEIVKDMQVGTHYPPEILFSPSAQEIAALVYELSDSFKQMQQAGDAGSGSLASTDAEELL